MLAGGGWAAAGGGRARQAPRRARVCAPAARIGRGGREMWGRRRAPAAGGERARRPAGAVRKLKGGHGPGSWNSTFRPPSARTRATSRRPMRPGARMSGVRRARS